MAAIGSYLCLLYPHPSPCASISFSHPSFSLFEIIPVSLVKPDPPLSCQG